MNRKGLLQNTYTLFLLLFLAAGIPACNEKDPAHPNEHVNVWIHANMRYWYYWNSELPEDPDKTEDPELFFNSLLSPHDRFSWIQENFHDLINSLRGVTKEAGYEIKLYRVSAESTEVLAQVLYIKQNSPAEIAGLKRGDLINAINGEGITIDNYKTLLNSIRENHTITYRALDLPNQTHGATQTMTLSPVELAENPNFLHHVFTYNDRKIGYYVYNLFSPGATATGTEYNNEMDQVFASFQAEGITDLVLDLRFNSGGAETAANNLASLMGKGVDGTKIFTKRRYNDQVTAAIEKEPEMGAAFLKIHFQNKSQNIGNQLINGRVYILTGSRTASASELIINGLRPYMDVFLVGIKTIGKNVGSISLYDEMDPDNTWGMQPIITKSFNSLDQSDYDTGFTPQILDEDNGYYIYPLGDPNERLLKRALDDITGSPQTGRKQYEKTFGAEVGHSLDLKKRTGILVIDLPTVVR